MEILPAIPEDARGIKEVQYKTWLATYPNQEVGITVDDVEDRFKDAFSEASLKKNEDKIRNKSAENREMFVAKEDGKIIGFCTVTRQIGKNQLNAIYVLPESQGKGIGLALWQRATEFIDPTKDTTVEVASYNAQAIEFYKKLGFAETGRYFHDERFKMKSGAILPEAEMMRKAAASAA